MYNFILSLQYALPTPISFAFGVIAAIAFFCLLCKPKTRKTHWIYVSVYCVGMILFIPAVISFFMSIVEI